MRKSLPFFLAAVVVLFAGCGAPSGPHVRFAHAAPAEIDEAAHSNQVVWYDFEVGDEVPLMFGLIGVAEAVTDTPTRMVAQRAFSIVVFPDGRTMWSFDGRSLVDGSYAAQWSVMLGAGDGGGRAGILLYVGRPGDAPAGHGRH